MKEYSGQNKSHKAFFTQSLLLWGRGFPNAFIYKRAFYVILFWINPVCNCLKFGQMAKLVLPKLSDCILTHWLFYFDTQGYIYISYFIILLLKPVHYSDDEPLCLPAGGVALLPHKSHLWSSWHWFHYDRVDVAECKKKQTKKKQFYWKVQPFYWKRNTWTFLFRAISVCALSFECSVFGVGRNKNWIWFETVVKCFALFTLSHLTFNQSWMLITVLRLCGICKTMSI